MFRTQVTRVLTLLALVGASLALPALALAPAAHAASPPLPATVSADSLPTVQMNGVVWKQVIAGNTVFAGGEFTSARPAGAAAGTQTVPRSNLLAYDIRTGVMDSSFAPTFNGKINDMAVTPDGSKLVVVGTFTTVNSQARNRVAIFNLPSMSLNTTVLPRLNGVANSVAATNSTLYFGGYFSAVNTTTRQRIGAASATTGATLPFTVPVDDGQVQSLVVSPDQASVVLSGTFTTVGGSNNPGYGLYRADAVTGAGQPLPVNSEFRDAGGNSGVMRLSSDGENFYGVGWHYGAGGNAEGTFAAKWSDGTVVWLEDCHGDTYDVASINDVVYTVSHKHYCGNSGGFPQTDPWTFWRANAFSKSVQGTNFRDMYGYPDHPGTPRPALLSWHPDTPAGSYTGKGQASWAVTGNAQYVLLGGEFPRVNGAVQQGIARFAVRSIAPNKQGPRTVSGGSFAPTLRSYEPGKVRVTWPAAWDRDDRHLTYQVFRTNTSTKVYEGEQTSSQWNGQQMSFTDTGQTPGASVQYAVRVLDPSGNLLNSTWASTTVSGTSQVDAYASKVLADGASKYWRLGETSGNAVGDLGGTDATTAGTGVSRNVAGALLTSGDRASNFNGSSSGRVISSQIVTSPDVSSQEVWFRTSSNGGGKLTGFGNRSSGNSSVYDRHLYMGGGRVYFGVYTTGQQTISSQAGLNNGQWHQAVGTLGPNGMSLYIDGKLVANRTDVTQGRAYPAWFRIGGDNSWFGDQNFNGALDEVAVYPSVLTPQQVDSHWVASGRPSTNPTPTNAPPTAAFTSTTAGLTASFQASGSSDTDGTIASYSWSWGDGKPAGSGVSPDHAYDSAGTYPVTLTVTDDDGATDSVTRNVVVTTPPPAGVLGSDAFERTAANGWGAADVGGAWAVRGTASRFSVASGTGRLQVPAGSTLYTDLSSVSSTSTRATTQFSVDKVIDGTYVGLVGRQVGADTYNARVRIQASGQAQLYLLRTSGQIGTLVVPGLTITPGEKYTVKLEVRGTSPTTVSAKVWQSSAAEPAAWQLTGTNTFEALQAPGRVGTYGYLPAAAANGPVTISFDNFSAVDAG